MKLEQFKLYQKIDQLDFDYLWKVVVGLALGVVMTFVIAMVQFYQQQSTKKAIESVPVALPVE